MKRAILAAGILLAGCATSPQERQAIAESVPDGYRAQITAYYKSALKDPDSVKGAMISGPTTAFVGLLNGGNVPAVCVRFNAKNSMGGYVGLRTTAVVFRDGRISGTTPPIQGTCEREQWQEYPELNGLG
jgi:hypothetical protein